MVAPAAGASSTEVASAVASTPTPPATAFFLDKEFPFVKWKCEMKPAIPRDAFRPPAKCGEAQSLT
ncbi:hypothetical protein GCM10017786_41440 [Amycolatopsis deserti]|uniref:Uncharacterized protein n=1 Tax=Amycolatopsis deserti TaxID=185696 RepID=A0ABQ3J4U3_9PSEU|nr:hypothetical protein GCM10017786_41440 [Amycolatopsis deserti]